MISRSKPILETGSSNGELLSRVSLSGVLCLGVLLSGCLQPQTMRGWTIPLERQPTFKAFAHGERVYVCKSQAQSPAQLEWVLQGEEANLYDQEGRRIGVQRADTTFVAADGSKIQGRVMEEVKAPSCGAIPWALFSVTSRGGKGMFSDVTQIERVYTAGGRAPAAWHRGTKEGAEARVNYSATYCFHVSS